MGMGGAFVAVADDSSAAYWNVAGLSQLSSYELTLSSAPVYFTEHITGGSPAFGFPYYASMQFIMPIAKENTLGISIFRPFHPQFDLYTGDATNPSPSPLQAGEASYLANPTFQQSEIVLSYAARFSAIQNFSVGINVKRITNDNYYIRYFGNNQSVSQALATPIQVLGYGVDVGVLFRIPITKYTEELRLGLALKNLVNQVTYTNGVSFIEQGAAINIGSGYTGPIIPPEITIGLAYKNNFLFKIRNITDLDFDQVSDSNYNDSNVVLASKYLRFGTEFWFFNDILGLRGGYSTPFIAPGTLSLGLSVRVLNGDFQSDLAYLMPVGPSPDLQSGENVNTSDQGGINYEPFHIGLTYRFGGGQELPPPKVSAYVQPPSFTPSQNEATSFFLDTTEDVPIHHWSVMIYDQNDHLVRSLRGQGPPPSKIVWGGEDDLYRPLPAGVYTWSFQVEDQLDHIGSSPVQTIELVSPVNTVVKDTTKLMSIRQQEAGLLAQERSKLTALAQQTLKNLLGEGSSNTSVAVAPTPIEAQGNTQYPQTGGVPSLGFPSLTPDQPLNAHFDKNYQGDEIIAVSYKSQQSYVPYLYQEAADVIKATVNSVGTGLKEISTRVYYGKNEMDLVTSTQAAANYASGKITQLQLMQLTDIRINGVKVGPNGY